jgi:glycosyltransferase involved in cell wall biosynthesis
MSTVTPTHDAPTVADPLGGDRPLRVLVVTPIPTPYRDPFWSVLARRPDIDLEVLYCASGKRDRPWQASWDSTFRQEVLPGHNLARWFGVGSSCYLNPGIRERLRKSNIDALIVGGYNHPTMLWAMRYARRNGIPYYLMSESHLRRQRGPLRRMVKHSLVRRVVSHAAGGFPTGQLAARYLVHYGARPENLCFIPNVPDVEKYASRARALRPQRADHRRRLGLPEAPLVLFAGRLLPFKGVDTLLRAFARVVERSPAHLAIIGDGPQGSDLRHTCEELGLTDRVRFVGFVQPEEMPLWYSAADLFVLPSSETWGVVVLEALASGVPVVITDEVGCHPDVLNDERVGETVRPRDPAELADALVRRLSHGIPPDVVADAWRPVFERMQYAAIADATVEHLRQRPLKSGNPVRKRPVECATT